MSAFNRRDRPRDPIVADAMRLMRELDAEKTDGPVRAHWVGRMLARLIDLAIMFASVIVIIAAMETIAVAVGAELREEDGLELTRTGTIVSWISLVGLIGFGAGYEIVSTWLFGGTFGKRRMGLRVVRLDGTRIGLGTSAARFGTWGIPFLCCLVGWGATFPGQPLPSLAFFLGAFASLGLIASAGRDADGRGVHDRVAGTKVLTWE
jgi:uncharacterized RDD family membrane protein YckC